MDKSLLKARKLSYLINNFDDVNLDCQYQYTDDEDLANQVVDFFQTESQLIYPAKSYFVAIVYAKCLNKFFKKDFYKMLDDKALLPDDKYFIRYSSNKDLYDRILSALPQDIFVFQSIQKTVNYFKQEFLVEE